ncbi:MAG: ABC transporter permease [Lachnospiraceae bacterium]|nr:ABC transporter permease [Lachnospiraceae bacterium]
MNRTLAFAKRNLVEMSRDTLSYIFCVVFPIVMLIVMSVVNQSIPLEAGMTIFRIDNLLGGIIVFGHTFLMLFTALTVSQDRYGSFLVRLYASPMKSRNFTNGYILPMILIGVLQSLVSVAAALIISFIVGYDLNIGGLLLAIIAAIPSSVMFISIGLIFGTLFNRNSAPGLCSVIISLGSFIGGIWFDAEGIGGVIGKVCKCFPFIYATKSVRSVINLDLSMEAFGLPIIVTSVVAIVFLALSAILFSTKMKADLS